MTLGVISDVHGNLEALKAVLGALEGLGGDSMVCLGDLVGYNADPEGCVEAVQARCRLVIRGNHDKAAAGLLGLDWFNPVAAAAMRWTRQALTPPTLERLRTLPSGPARIGPEVVACHGAPFHEDVYLVSRDGFRAAFEELTRRFSGARFCLFGHTHVPLAVEERTGQIRTLRDGEEELDPGARYLLNPGSVGQPRDGNPLASFAILDTDRGSWRVLRVPYPIQETRRKIAAAGLPPELGARLAAGW